MRIQFLGPVCRPAVLMSLRERRINYEQDEVRRPHWNFDRHRHRLGTEPPGPPVDGGLWHRACWFVRDYEFSPPELLRAAYYRDAPLLHRDMLLEGRFAVLRFLMGVRITELLDGTRDDEQAWGWSYETLEGHLERGRVDYHVVKNLTTGAVDFVTRSYSQLNPGVGHVLRLGWALFGRRAQLRFYRRIGERLEVLVHRGADMNHEDMNHELPGGAGPWGTRARGAGAWGEPPGGVVTVPSEVRPRWWERFTVALRDLGR